MQAQLFGNAALANRPNKEADEAYSEPKVDMLQSPTGMRIRYEPTGPTFVRVRILNRSPTTDLFFRWEGVKKDLEYSRQKRCPMKADLNEWQEVTCFSDETWDEINQVSIAIPQSVMRGDIWVDQINIGDGLIEPEIAPIDLASGRVVPHIGVPSLSQSGFADAFKVIQECLITNVPVYGFTYPVTSPGANGEGYGENWWPLDSSLTVRGAQWANQRFADDVMRGFRDVQAGNPDGNISDRGYSGVRGQVSDFSQIPRFFEAAYDTARRTADSRLRNEIYETMRRYLDWWLSSVKRDSRTGLISGVGEETFNEHDAFGYGPQSRAHVDTNVAVAVGSRLTAHLASLLGKGEEARRYERTFGSLSEAINTYLWDSDDGVYYNFDLKSGRRMPRLIVSTFDPLRMNIAPPNSRRRLVEKLQDPTLFNWGSGPLTGLAKSETDYEAALNKGAFTYANGIQAWLGDITTFRNLPIVEGLKESGLSQLAAELNWHIVTAFHGNYAEHLFPTSNRGDGVRRYGWSAAGYIEAVIANLFGIEFSTLERRVRVIPLIPRELYNKQIELTDLVIPGNSGARLSVRVEQYAVGKGKINVDITGEGPVGDFEVGLPGKTRIVKALGRRSFVVIVS